LNQEEARLVRDNSETVIAAEATVKKKKKPVIQETSCQISAWKKSVSGMQEETSYTLYKKPVIRSLTERKKKRRSQIYNKPVIRSLLEEENESRTQMYKSTSRSLVVQYDICM